VVVVVAGVGHSQLLHIDVVDNRHYDHNGAVGLEAVVLLDNLHNNVNNHRRLLELVGVEARHLELREALLLLLVLKEQNNASRNMMHMNQHMLPEIQLLASGLVLPLPAINY
jgi:hypothetical protein